MLCRKVVILSQRNHPPGSLCRLTGASLNKSFSETCSGNPEFLFGNIYDNNFNKNVGMVKNERNDMDFLKVMVAVKIELKTLREAQRTQGIASKT